MTHCPTDNRKSRDARASKKRWKYWTNWKSRKYVRKNSGSIWSIPPCGKKRNLGGRDRCCHACGKILIPCDSDHNMRTFKTQSFSFFRFSKVHRWLRLRLVSAPSLFHFHLHLIPKFVWSFYNNCGNISVWGGGAIIILFQKFAIAQEPKVRLTSNPAVNSSLYFVSRPLASSQPSYTAEVTKWLWWP